MRGDPGDLDRFGNPNELAALGDREEVKVWDALMTRLVAVPAYVAMFQAAFPGVGRFRFEHAAQTLAAFQMQEFTRTNSPFDRYLNREDNALTTEQKRGGLLFFGKAQCSGCHNGPFLGGQGLANVGAPQVGPGGSRRPPLDLGRGEHIIAEGYDFAFRIAPLRNVELTAPYFHSGAYSTLEAVVRHYNDVPEALRSYDPAQLAPAVRSLYHGDPATANDIIQLLDFRLREPLRLSDQEIAQLVAFLKALTDPAARDLRGLAPATVPSGLDP
jgi:cytochrome c peroxidase